MRREIRIYLLAVLATGVLAVSSPLEMVDAKVLFEQGGGGSGGGETLIPTSVDQVESDLLLLRTAQENYYSDTGTWFVSHNVGEINANLGVSVNPVGWVYAVGNPPIVAQASTTTGDLKTLEVDLTSSPRCIAGICQIQQSNIIGGESSSGYSMAGTTPWLTGGAIKSSVVMADFNTNVGFDGSEVVVGSDDYNIYVFRSDGTPYLDTSNFFRSTSGIVESTAAFADMNLDASLDLIIGSVDKKLYVLDSNGNDLPGWPKQLPYPLSQIRSAPVVANISGDSHPEIIVSSVDQYVYVLNYLGDILWSRYALSAILSSPAVGDLNNDGNFSIIVGSQDKYVYKWDANGIGGAIGSIKAGAINSSPALADINGDGKYEITIGSSATAGQGKLYLLKPDGSDAAGWAGGKTLVGEAWSSPAVADLDGVGDPVYDQDLEIVVATNSGYVYAFHRDGSNVVGWPKSISGSPIIDASPIIADIDNNGDLEVIVAAQNGYVYAFNHNGTPFTSAPWDASGRLGPVGPIAKTTPMLGDLTGNGQMHLLSGSNDMSIHPWNLGSIYDPDGVKWGKFRHDLANTGVFARPDRQPPVVGALSDYNVEVGQPVNFTVSATDNNAMMNIRMHGDSLSGASFNYTNGNNSGDFSWTPTSTGVFDIYFIATDEYGLHSACEFDTAAPTCDHVIITVSAPSNTAPVISGFPDVATDEDIPSNNAIDLWAYVSDAETPDSGLVFTKISDTNPQAGVTIDSNRYIDINPAANWNGFSDVTIKVTDPGGLFSQDVFRVTINSINDAPVADDEVYPATEDVVLNVSTANGLLVGDTDVDGNPLTLVSCSAIPANQGTLTCNADGSFVYTPFSNFNGTVNFTYTVRDNGTPPLTDVGAVTINVAPVNDAPLAFNDSYSTPMNTDLVVPVPGVLINDTDVEGSALTANRTGALNPTNGTLVTFNANGSFTYRPNNGYVGSDSFTYRANDGELNSGYATVNISISNSTPTLVGIPDIATNEDVPLNNAIDLYSYAADPETPDSGLTFTIQSSSQASAGVSLDSNRYIDVNPVSNWYGSSTVVIRVTDPGGLWAEDTFIVTVNPVNDAPVADDETYPATEDTVLNVSTANGLLVGDTDVDGNPLTLVSCSAIPANQGTLTCNADGSFVYTPFLNFNGQVNFTYTVRDNGTPPLTDVGAVTINVAPVNDAPVADDEVYPATEDVVLNVSTANGLLVGDTDVDGNPLTLVSCSAIPANQGTLACNADGSFVYTPFSNFNGTVNFTYTVRDNGTPPLTDVGAVTINVAPVNDRPVAINDSGTALEDTAKDINVIANDTDPDTGDVLSVDPTSITSPSNGTVALQADNKTIRYTPNANWNGIDTYTYKVKDAAGLVSLTAATVTVTVTPVNDAPVADDETYPATEDTVLNVSTANGLLVGDTDVDGNPLTLVSCSAIPANQGTLTCNPDGSFVYTPFPNFNGTVNFTYTVSDNGIPPLTDVGAVTINVAPVNDAPVADDEVYPATEDVVLNVSTANGLLIGDIDPDGDPLTLVSCSAIPANQGTLTCNADGSFVYIPFLNFSGPVNFTYTVRDNATPPLTDVGAVTINVAPVNDAPVADDEVYPATEDVVLNVSTANGLLVGDIDPDGDPLTLVSCSAIPANQGTLTCNADGSFVYSPYPNFNGPVNFTYIVRDNGTPPLTDVGAVTINVGSVNNAPVADDETYPATEDTVLNVSTANGLLIGDTDIDGDQLTLVSCSAIPANQGTLTCNPDGSFVYTPFSNFNGTVNFTYTVTDNGIPPLTDDGAVTINVAPVNDAPIANNDSYATDEDIVLTVTVGLGVLSNDTDIDGDALNAIKLSNPSHGSVTLNPDGSFTYTPDANYHGPDMFTYKANDGTDDSNPATVSITVNSVNDTPIMDPLSDQVANEGDMLSFVVKAYDPDGGQVQISVSNNPAGSSLSSTVWNAGSGRWEATFSWPTDYDDAGIYPDVVFAANEYTPPPPPPPPGGHGCFLAGTMITMANGSQKPIEQIKVGDRVRAYDETTQKIKSDKVTYVFNHDKEDTYLIINDGVLKVTPIHRVLSKGQWIPIGMMQVGDTLTDSKGHEVRINKIEMVKEIVNIYNFEVNPLHTYVANGIIVHNRKLPVEDGQPQR